MSGPFVLPCCNQFLEHWNRLAALYLMPHTRTFVDRATDLIRDALILELMPERTLVRFMDSGLVARWQQDFTCAHLEGFVARNDQVRLRRNMETVCHHPAGLRAMDETRTSTGRKLEYEMMALPLAVDADKPRLCVVYRQNLTVLD